MHIFALSDIRFLHSGHLINAMIHFLSNDLVAPKNDLNIINIINMGVKIVNGGVKHNDISVLRCLLSTDRNILVHVTQIGNYFFFSSGSLAVAGILWYTE